MKTYPHARVPHRARPLLKRSAALTLALGCCAGLTGCFGFLKPAPSTAHSYILTAAPASGASSQGPEGPALGLGRVKMPAYLASSSLAVRRGTNEVQYLPNALWAERLQSGFERVLAADLAATLQTDKIRTSAWNRDAVTAELYVTVEQFDVEASGRGLLVARWRILSPGGDKVLQAGTSRLSRPGPGPDSDPSGAVATLSELVTELARDLATAVRQVGTH